MTALVWVVCVVLVALRVVQVWQVLRLRKEQLAQHARIAELERENDQFFDDIEALEALTSRAVLEARSKEKPE